jgi:hypothetical protein
MIYDMLYLYGISDGDLAGICLLRLSKLFLSGSRKVGNNLEGGRVSESELVANIGNIRSVSHHCNRNRPTFLLFSEMRRNHYYYLSRLGAPYDKVRRKEELNLGYILL